jgi:hyperosmotically inducible periplasmic protein
MAHSLSIRALVVAFAALALGACDREAGTEAKRSAEAAGQRVDRALDRTGQKLAEAGEKTQQKLAQAGERMKPGLEEAGARISEAGEKVAATVKDVVAPERSATTTTITTGPATSLTGLPAQTREALGDTAITASIKTGFLKDPDLSVLKIDVDTRDGVVTLNGLADNEEARGRAEKIAAATKGVREVRNHLTVKRG